MEPIIIEATKMTPRVVFDKTQEIFLIKGRSLPENAFAFYEPILEWFKEYLNNPNPNTVLTFEFEYFNSSTSKAVFQLLQMLEKPVGLGLDVKVNWCHYEEDEDTLETGQTYANLVNVPFVFSVINS